MSAAAGNCSDPVAPPAAKKVEHRMEMFGDVRIDNYYWLRDDSRSDPDVLSHLQRENAYTDSVMAGTKQLEDNLFAEIRGRIKEDDISAPTRRGPYYYYSRYLEGKEYIQHCRQLIPDSEAPPSVYDKMPTGPEKVTTQSKKKYVNSLKSLINDTGTKQLEDNLFAEIRGHIKEDDISAPTCRGSYYYYDRYLEGKEYIQHCRRLIPDSEAPPVYDKMPTGPEAPPEQVILDENIKAQNHSFYHVAAFQVNPSNKLVAYAEDTKGDEKHTVYVIDADKGATVGKPLKNVTSYLEWAGDDALVYITMDEILRPDKVWLHRLGTEQSDDICLYHEKDDIFSLDLEVSESKKFLFVASESKNTTSTFYFNVSKPEDGLQVLTPRIYGEETRVSHRGNNFFIRRRSDLFYNSELLACPLDDVSNTTVLIPHRESVKITDMQLFADHLVLFERENGSQKVTVYRLPVLGEPLTQLQGGCSIDFDDPVFSVDQSESQFSSNILRFTYSSMRTPPSVYDHDMDTGISVVKKIETVLGGFDESNYVSERKWATAPDGTQIPMSIVYRKNMVKLDASDPLLLYGYGSYEICIDPSFKGSRLSLLDRGFIYVIAHIRGGGEMGRPWYDNGKLLKKKNTFTDFIACAEYLIEKGYCTKEKLCINGRSAGGLLMGAVLNMRPDLFRAAVAGVPFLDAVTTMLDPTIPLTTSEWEEWGDPRTEEYYHYMKSYSPVDNVRAQNYPHILVTAGLNDSRVLYSEPAKFVAKLRDLKTDDNMLLFKCEMGAGHFSKSGRFEKLQEEAFTYAFLLKALNMIPTHVSA
ncbi:dipeptidyl aminopeptidase BI isoform X1 [Eucalyptus grandis]|uniref:dipeptidyl aminopeptidase BI isoform X1 n=1 Tax=Eucalyptus grandis TaxID=71139 RepID=UPI00192EC5F2|nr:dipeptidyl aminopeptidase BI isoform X1 [Eucalyptus grandis]